MIWLDDSKINEGDPDERVADTLPTSTSKLAGYSFLPLPGLWQDRALVRIRRACDVGPKQKEGENKLRDTDRATAAAPSRLLPNGLQPSQLRGLENVQLQREPKA